MDQKYCQSCGMPLEAPEQYGTNADGTPNEEYCSYCYQNGAYTADVTMDEMIDVCVPYMANEESGMTADEARAMMQQMFPTLKRWAK